MAVATMPASTAYMPKIALLAHNGCWLSASQSSSTSTPLAAPTLSAHSPSLTSHSILTREDSAAGDSICYLRFGECGLYLTISDDNVMLVAERDESTSKWSITWLPDSFGRLAILISPAGDDSSAPPSSMLHVSSTGVCSLRQMPDIIVPGAFFQVLNAPFVFGSIAPLSIRHHLMPGPRRVALWSPATGWVSARQGSKNWLGKQTGWELESRYDQLNDWECFMMEVLRGAGGDSSDGRATAAPLTGAPANALVTFLSHHGLFVSADVDAGLAVVGDRKEAKEWERFEIVPWPVDDASRPAATSNKNATSDCVTAVPGTRLPEVYPLSMACAIRSHHGTFISTADKKLHAKTRELGPTEILYLVDVEEARRHYWGSRPAGQTYAAPTGKLSLGAIAGIAAGATIGAALLAGGIAAAVMASPPAAISAQNSSKRNEVQQHQGASASGAVPAATSTAVSSGSSASTPSSAVAAAGNPVPVAANGAHIVASAQPTATTPDLEPAAAAAATESDEPVVVGDDDEDGDDDEGALEAEDAAWLEEQAQREREEEEERERARLAAVQAEEKRQAAEAADAAAAAEAERQYRLAYEEHQRQVMAWQMEQAERQSRMSRARCFNSYEWNASCDVLGPNGTCNQIRKYCPHWR